MTKKILSSMAYALNELSLEELYELQELVFSKIKYEELRNKCFIKDDKK